DSIGLKRDRRLHGGEADELHDVIGHHVTESTGVVIIAATLLNPDGLSHRDLYVVDVTAVPDRLENPVGKSERQNVLNGFFSEVVVDTIDLFLARYAQKLLIEQFGGFQVMPARFLNDDAPP